MNDVEKQLKIIIYILFSVMFISGFMFGGMFYVFTFVSLDLFLVYLIVELTFLYPEDMKTWNGLRNLTLKKIWDAIKL